MYSSFPKIMMSTSKSLKSEGILSSNEASSASSKFVYSPVVSEPSTSYKKKAYGVKSLII